MAYYFSGSGLDFNTVLNMPLGDVQELRYIQFKEKEEYSRIEKEREKAKEKQEANKKAGKKDINEGIEPIYSEFPLPEQCPLDAERGILGSIFG